MKDLTISRRTLLKGLGVSIALPTLEAMSPMLSYTASASASPATGAPKRVAFVYVPNGIIMQDWTPSRLGSNFDLPHTLEPLQTYKNDMLVLSGLTLDKARSNGDGGGDHARAMAAFLTGCQPRKTHGADLRAGISVDQVIAQHNRDNTRFASLEIGCEGGRLAGNCDSGYSCAYSNTISWRAPSTPNPKEDNPRQLFDRLFGGQDQQESAQSRSRRDEYNQSILDFVSEDANRLMNRLGNRDRQRMDEYLSSIRDIERRIARNDSEAGAPRISRPSGIPGDYGEYIRLMGDLLALSFQTDLTRVGTFVFANEGSNRSYRNIDIRDGHHSLSHHQNRREKIEKLKRINHFHINQFAHFLGRLRAIREGDGTLLDNCIIVYGSGNADGNRHTHHDLPILVVGKGGGTLSTGRHVRYRRETPLMNLYLSMLDRLDIRVPRHGDSTGRLSELST